jgi:hypothetical protein
MKSTKFFNKTSTKKVQQCNLQPIPPNCHLHLRQERPPVGCGSRSVRSDVLLSEAADIMAEAEVHHLLAPLAMDLGMCPGAFIGDVPRKRW